MENLQAAIGFYREQAQAVYVLALREKDTNRRRVLLAICEHYYLLHDQLLELARISRPEEAAAISRGHVVPSGLGGDLFAVTRDPFGAM